MRGVRPWRARAAVLGRSLVFWTVWFAVARALFFAWQRRTLPLPAIRELVRSFLFGMRMDLSAAAYLTVVPWIMLTLCITATTALTRRLLSYYSAVAVAFVALVTVTDLQTFSVWRTRLDASLWTYLQTPQEALASSASIPAVTLISLLLGFGTLLWWSAQRVLVAPVARLVPVAGRAAAATGGALGLSGLLLVIPIRGGVQWTPLNESSVFFTQHELANQGALNAGWYLIHSTLAAQQVPASNPYEQLAQSDAQAVIDSLFPTTAPHIAPLLRTPRPNVVLIIWESFTAKVAGRLGGVAHVTPAFDRWSHEGVLFDSVFASGDRSAQGLVSILSGYPSVPNEWIMNRPTKAQHLPHLGTALREAGYHTSYYYGGELAFANMKAYVLNGGFDRITGIEAFSADERNSKWGAHDHVVLSRAIRDLQHEPRPFFSTVFTLSSHEPFDIPSPPVFAGEDEQTRFLNAHHYADASIGAFLDSARRAPWWDSTLVVIIADHGNVLPVPPSGAESVLGRHHIPMLWLGGALRVRDTVVHRIGAQVDLAPTLLAQLSVPARGFRWGGNLLATDRPGFAYFAHQSGFAFIDRTGWVVFDERARRAIEQSPTARPAHVRSGAALLQATFDDYLGR